MQIRPARHGEVSQLLQLIRALAEYEREPQAVQATEDDLRAALFPADGPPAATATVAVSPGSPEPDRLLGMALWFRTFSTWTGKPGIWLEDLFVPPQHRGHGIGRALLADIASRCVQAGYPRLEWSVLTWNTPSIEFYRGLGARPMEDWTQYRLSGEPLAQLADSAIDGPLPETGRG